jgi:hypothetical protein
MRCFAGESISDRQGEPRQRSGIYPVEFTGSRWTVSERCVRNFHYKISGVFLADIFFANQVDLRPHLSSPSLMSEERIKALLIEDSEADYVLISEYISSSINTSFELERADRLSTGIEMINHTQYDVALLDLSLPDSSGKETVAEFRE